ncbi:MAG TPA: Lar family restriction alleviation protein [Sphingomicrobium sp.]|nr:Lar family restriction alleviation protein [Sphingomicrobium sp.]
MSVQADDCPFCGSDSPTSIATRDGAVVRCMDCGALGPPALRASAGEHHELAIKHWNKRAANPVDLSPEDERKLTVKAGELVAAAEGVLEVISVPTLAKKTKETKAILMGMGDYVQ